MVFHAKGSTQNFKKSNDELKNLPLEAIKALQHCLKLEYRSRMKMAAMEELVRISSKL